MFAVRIIKFQNFLNVGIHFLNRTLFFWKPINCVSVGLPLDALTVLNGNNPVRLVPGVLYYGNEGWVTPPIFGKLAKQTLLDDKGHRRILVCDGEDTVRQLDAHGLEN